MSHDDELIATVEELSPKVVAPVDDNVVKAPVPGVAAPIEAKFAAPAPVIFQLASLRTKSLPDVLPMVMVPVEVPVPMLVAAAPEVLILVAPVIVVAPFIPVVPVSVSVSKAEPILIVSAFVLSVAILIVLPAVPVAILIVFALLFVPRFTSPVVPESTVTAPVVPEVSDKAVPAPEVIEPAPAKPSAVAETEIVSSEETEERAPELITIPFIVSVAVLAVIVPFASTAKLVPAMTFVPVPVPSVKVPVPFALTVNPVSDVDGEITGLAPEKVNALAVKVLVLIVPVTIRLLSTFTSPPENSNWSEVL